MSFSKKLAIFLRDSIYNINSIYINSLNDWFNCIYFCDYYFYFEIKILIYCFYFLSLYTLIFIINCII